MKWLRDEDFIRGKIPMTKFDIRALTIAMLDINKGDILLDIGAGTGSITVQAALLGAAVIAIEKEPLGIELILNNAEKFKVMVNAINGDAPEEIKNINGFNKCFVGGSGGKLKEIVEEVTRLLPIGGILVGNFIIPDNMVEFKNLLEETGYDAIEVKLIQTSVMDKYGLMKGQNPVFIVGGRKK
jgi:cobalt-precorrin-6B (C15)-methyltransferase